MIGSLLRVRYELTALLSQGPVFDLYAARDQVQLRDVSVRMLKPPFGSEEQFVERLRDLVDRASIVQHPGIERLFELDEHEGVPFIVGEPIKGSPLAERLRKLVSFSVPVANSTVISICEGVEALHNSGIVHGDLGLHNITLLADGSTRVQLPGIWDAYSASPTAGAVVLRLMAPYMAPEVSAGAMPSPSSDIYSIGVLLFELLSGRQPYVAETPVALAMKHATAPTPSVKLFNSSVPVVLDEIIKKAMSKDPALRYPTAAALLHDLRILQDAIRFGRSLTWPIGQPEAPPAPGPQPPPVRPPKPAREERIVRTYEDSPDVPLWLKISIAFFSAIALSMLGFWLIFNLNRARDVSVPNLAKMNRAEAERVLKSLGVTLVITREQPSESYPADTIVETDPPANEKVREGGEVRAVISSGSRFVEVPDLRGLTVDQATVALEKLKLRLSDRVPQVPNREIPAGLIVSQNVEPRSKIERGSDVRVEVSSGRTTGDRTDPRDLERYAYTLKIKTTGVEESVSVRVVMTDAQGASTIYEQVHEPDDEFEVYAEGYGPEATFRIFYNGTLVKQITKRAGAEDRL